MKQQFITVFAFMLCLLMVQNATAQQRISADVHFKTLGADKVEGVDSTDVTYDSENSFSANVKFYDKNLWAFRVGVGFDRLNYSIGDGIDTDFDITRNNLTTYIGLEKHFGSGWLMPYTGVFVPITFNGNDNVTDNINNISEQWKNGDIKTGFSVLAGLNLKLFKILRLGAEFNVGFDKFKSDIIQPLRDDVSSVKLKNLDYNTEITLGIAF